MKSAIVLEILIIYINAIYADYQPAPTKPALDMPDICGWTPKPTGALSSAPNVFARDVTISQTCFYNRLGTFAHEVSKKIVI